MRGWKFLKILKKILKEAEGSFELILSNEFNDSKNKFEIEDAITLAFFEDMVRKTDSLVTLIDGEKLVSMDIISRSIFESYVYLKLILKNDRRLYARSYIASQKASELSLYNSLIAENKDGMKIRSLIGKQLKDIKRDLNFEGDEQSNKIQSQFSDVYDKRNVKQKWYNLDNKTKNLEQLCRKLDMFPEYELVYRMLSSEVHSSDVLKRLRFESNQIYVQCGFTTDSDMNIAIVKMFLLEAITDLYTFSNLKKELKTFNLLVTLSHRLSKNK